MDELSENPYRAPAAEANQLYDEKHQQQLVFRFGLVLAAVTLTPPLVLIVGIHWWAPLAVRTLAGASAATFLGILVQNRFAGVGVRAVEKRLRSSLHAEGIDVAEATFIEFSPDRELSFYANGMTNWDVGLLFFFDDSLAYLGAKTRFALPRSSLLAVRKSKTFAGWTPFVYLYVDYSDAAGAASCRLSAAGGHSLGRLSRRSEELFNQIRAWLDAPTDGQPPPWAQELGPPVTSEASPTPSRRFILGQLAPTALSFGFLGGAMGAAWGLAVELPALFSTTAAVAFACALGGILVHLPFVVLRERLLARIDIGPPLRG